MTRSLAALRSRPLAFAASLLSFTLVGVLLYVAKEVLIPVALALLLTFLLSPLVTRLGKHQVPRVAAVLIVVGLAGLLFAGLVALVGYELHGLANELPEHRDNIRAKVLALRELTRGGVVDTLTATFHDAIAETAKETPPPTEKKVEAAIKPPLAVRVVPDDVPEKSVREALAPYLALAPLIEPLAAIGMALILAIFMLIKREDLRNRLVSLTSFGGLTTTTKALDDAGHRIGRYLLMQLIVNGSFGVAVGIGLLIVGVPYAPLWGLCAGVLRYIPYIGPWIAALLPLSVSLIMSHGWTQFALVLAIFLTLELISNNVMEPWLYGAGMGVSEVALIVSAAFWAWIWGPMGLILSAPLTVCVVVLGRYVPALAFLDRLLGDEPALAEHASYLQRLLARDAHEAGVIVEGYRAQHGPDAVYDAVFVPALALAKEERAKGLMTAEDELYVVDETRRIVDSLAPAAESPAGVPILGCPAHHESDELTLRMLGQLVHEAGGQVEVVSTKTLPSEVVARVRAEPPGAIVITAVPPGGLVQAYYLCKRLRKRAPRAQIVVGYLGYKRNLDKIIVKFRAAGANYVTTTLVGARSHLASALAAARTSPVAEPVPVAAGPVSS